MDIFLYQEVEHPNDDDVHQKDSEHLMKYEARLTFRPRFNYGFSQDVSITSLNICYISLFTVTLLQRKNE